MIGFKKNNSARYREKRHYSCRVSQCFGKKHFDDKEIEQYIGYITYYLDHYRERFGEDQEIEYLILKKYRKAELRVNVKAEKYAPDDFSDPNRISAELGLNSMLNNNAESMTNKYVRGVNILSFSTPTRKGKTPVIIICKLLHHKLYSLLDCGYYSYI